MEVLRALALTYTDLEAWSLKAAGYIACVESAK